MELEGKKQEFEHCLKIKEELVGKLNNHKKTMLQLKKQYDSEATCYVDSLIETEEINERIGKLGEELGEKHWRSHTVDIPGLYGYLGNLDERNLGLVVHESIAPATHGKEVWQLIKRKR